MTFTPPFGTAVHVRSRLDDEGAGRWRAWFAAGAVLGVAWLLFWLSAREVPWVRRDFFFLADAFLHGRTWLTFEPYQWDQIVIGNRTYVPFGPLPAILLMPLVAALGVDRAGTLEPGINTLLAAACVALLWVLLGRMRVRRTVDRLWLCALFGFSSPIWWIADRGGVWHTGQLVATVLTMVCLVELWGLRRPWLIGLVAGAAFLARPTLAFALPVYAVLLLGSWRLPLGRVAIVRLVAFSIAVVPSFAFFAWYNATRFGSPLESGYALAAVPAFLEAQRRQGLFSSAHLGMNVDQMFLRLPTFLGSFPFLVPDGYGMSIFLTSPGLLIAVGAAWRSREARLLLAAAALVLLPTLFYYGGGWKQYGYRYALDSMPFVVALCGLAVARMGRIPLLGRLLIVFGIGVNLIGVYWAFRL